jgi:glycosyltransferase involved in cell wall biosynthesis
MYFAHARLFEERGWQNAFFSMQHPSNVPCETSEYFAERIDYEIAGPIWQTLKNAGRVIYSQDARTRLSRLLDIRGVDIAHIHSVYHHLSPSVLMEMRARGIPTVLTAHELKLACPAYKMMNSGGVCERCKGGKIWHVALNRCIKDSLAASSLVMVESAVHKALNWYGKNVDRIVVPSRFYEQKLVEWGWDKHKLVYIPNFVRQIGHDEPESSQDYILYFGRLVPEKGLRTLIKAAQLSGVPIRIVGSGPEESSIKQLAREISAPVEFVEHLAGRELIDVVSSARATVLASEWYENAPMSVLESFQRGKPVIGSRIGGIPELISEGETGWIFTPGDAGDLASKLILARDLPTSRLKEMGASARESVAKEFTSARYYESMATLYDRLR